MANFDSPIGKKQVQGPVMKEFNVPDESGFTSAPPQVRSRPQQTAPVFDPEVMQDFQARMAPPQPPPQRDPNEIERQMMDLKRAKREGKDRLSAGAKHRIELLIGMTRLTKDIDIDGNIYRIRTLTSKELRDVLVAASEFDGNIQFIF
jgi:hypothetical protein